jgi:hypothetical protein
MIDVKINEIGSRQARDKNQWNPNLIL